MTGDVCGLNFVGCYFYHFKNGRLSQGFCYLSLSHFLVPRFGLSAWRLKCSKHVGPNSDGVP
jgi:hypothetical protein